MRLTDGELYDLQRGYSLPRFWFPNEFNNMEEAADRAAKEEEEKQVK